MESIPIRQCPSVFISALLREYCDADNFVLDVAKFSPATPVTLLVSCKLLAAECILSLTSNQNTLHNFS
jgi:hypothetical protein